MINKKWGFGVRWECDGGEVRVGAHPRHGPSVYLSTLLMATPISQVTLRLGKLRVLLVNCTAVTWQRDGCTQVSKAPAFPRPTHGLKYSASLLCSCQSPVCCHCALPPGRCPGCLRPFPPASWVLAVPTCVLALTQLQCMCLCVIVYSPACLDLG